MKSSLINTFRFLIISILYLSGVYSWFFNNSPSTFSLHVIVFELVIFSTILFILFLSLKISSHVQSPIPASSTQKDFLIAISAGHNFVFALMVLSTQMWTPILPLYVIIAYIFSLIFMTLIYKNMYTNVGIGEVTIKGLGISVIVMIIFYLFFFARASL